MMRLTPASTSMPPHPCRRPSLSECICRGPSSSPMPAKHGQRRATKHNAREAERIIMRERRRALGAQESWRGGGLAAERARSAAGSARARSGGRGEPRAYRSDGVAALGRPGAWPDAGGGLGLSALSSAAPCASGGGQAQATMRTKPRAPPRRRERAQPVAPEAGQECHESVAESQTGGE